MSNLIEFPLPDRPITEGEIDELHSQAFRDLEGGICDCTRMAKVAAQIVTDNGIDEELGFAVGGARGFGPALTACERC